VESVKPFTEPERNFSKSLHHEKNDSLPNPSDALINVANKFEDSSITVEVLSCFDAMLEIEQTDLKESFLQSLNLVDDLKLQTFFSTLFKEFGKQVTTDSSSHFLFFFFFFLFFSFSLLNLKI